MGKSLDGGGAVPSPATRARPSIRDIARESGVSVSTVSRAFSEPALVRSDTLERILTLAESRGYQPNGTHRSAAARRSSRIGVVVPDLGNPFFSGILKGAQAKAGEAGLMVFVAGTEESARLEGQLIPTVAQHVDGIIICASRLTAARLQEARGRTPVVIVNRRIDAVPSVSFDSPGGIRQAVDHLAALGHTHVAYLSGPQNSWSNQERQRGLRAAAGERGLEVIEFGPLAPNYEAGQHAADLVLASPATAVIAYNDLMAIGVLNRLSVREVSVPEQLSVVGFDNIPMAAMTTPPLTTVSLPLELAGRTAVELLVEQMDGDGGGPPEQELPAQLLVRGSTSVAR